MCISEYASLWTCVACIDQVLEALEDMQARKSWQAISIQTYHQPFEAQLATGQPHSLPLIVIPSSPPGISDFPSPIQVSFCGAL